MINSQGMAFFAVEALFKGHFNQFNRRQFFVIKIHPPVINALPVILIGEFDQLQNKIKLGELWKGSERLFTTWDGVPGYPGWPGYWFGKFLKRKDLPMSLFILSVYGVTDPGRFILVVAALKPGGVVRIITARDMTQSERRYYLREKGV